MVLLVLLAILGLLAGALIGRFDYDIQGYILVLLGGVALFVLLVIPRAAASEGRWFLRLAVLALFVRIGASLFRLYWAFGVKGGADAALYFRTGQRVATDLRQLDFQGVLGLMAPGTDFMQAVSGFAMAIIGPTLPGAYLFFALAAFLGALFYYKAFRVAFPQGNHKLYAALIFLYPSWVYWPSSLGKDSYMALMIGLSAYGVALAVCRRKLAGWLLVGAGLAGAAMVRPHVAALLAVSMAFPLALYPPFRDRHIAMLARVASIAIALAMAWLVVDRAAQFLKLESTSLEAGLERYEELQERAARGGSSFTPPDITNPLEAPLAVATVLFRPFPWEAPNLAALVLSLEGVMFASVLAWRLGSIKKAVFQLFSSPYLIFVLVYIVLFIPVFTTMGNFSLLGRQRLQLLPFVFMLVAYEGQRRKAESPSRAIGGPRLQQSPVPGHLSSG